MEVPSISHFLFEDVFRAIDRHLPPSAGDPQQYIEGIAREYTDEDETATAVVERVIAFMRVFHLHPVRELVRPVGNKHEIPRSFIDVAAAMPLREGEGFDPFVFAEAALLAWTAEGSA